MIDNETLAVAMNYANKLVEGGGAIKGKNCIITEIEEISGGHIVHFQWTLDDGTVETDTMTVMDGENGTVVSASETNGNIVIDGTETQVYDDSELQGIVSTDETTIEGNSINFSTLSAQTAESTIIDLEPIQDLHGYDKPWVGGAGKNKWSLGDINVESESGISFNLPAGTYTVQCDLPTSSTRLAIRFVYGDSTNILVDAIYLNNPKTFTLEKECVSINTFISNFTSGLVAGHIQIESGSTATSYEPYENECPISGRSEVDLVGCGRNLCKPSEFTLGLASITVGDDIDNITASWRYAYSPIYKTTNAIASMKSLDTTKVNWGCVVYGKNGKVVKAVFTELSTSSISTFYQDTDDYDCVRLEIGGPAGATTDADYVQIQLEQGSTATDYEPYTVSNDLTISLGQTVYGCRFDVENGGLVVDRKYDTLPDDYQSWHHNSNWASGTYRGEIFNDVKPLDGFDKVANLVSNMFETIAPAYIAAGSIGLGIGNGSSKSLFINAGAEYDTVAKLNTFLTNNTVQVVYELETPITINLTPHTINLLKGVNNISVDDTGATITLTYRDGSVATLGDVKALGDEMSQEIADSQILTDTVTGDKYKLVVTSGVLSIEQISNEEQAQTLNAPLLNVLNPDNLSPAITEPQIEEESIELPNNNEEEEQ